MCHVNRSSSVKKNNGDGGERVKKSVKAVHNKWKRENTKMTDDMTVYELFCSCIGLVLDGVLFFVLYLSLCRARHLIEVKGFLD